MSYLFRSEVIYYNAFAAATSITTSLDADEISQFCSALSEHISQLKPSDGVCCFAIIDLKNGKDEFFAAAENKFVKFNDAIVYYGNGITDAELSSINMRYASQSVLDALQKARADFRHMLTEQASDILAVA